MGRGKPCGGCLGYGPHKRWCRTVVGSAAAILGPLAVAVEDGADRMGSRSPDDANFLYSVAGVMESRAHEARQRFQEEQS